MRKRWRRPHHRYASPRLLLTAPPPRPPARQTFYLRNVPRDRERALAADIQRASGVVVADITREARSAGQAPPHFPAAAPRPCVPRRPRARPPPPPPPNGPQTTHIIVPPDLKPSDPVFHTAVNRANATRAALNAEANRAAFTEVLVLAVQWLEDCLCARPSPWGLPPACSPHTLARPSARRRPRPRASGNQNRAPRARRFGSAGRRAA